MSAVLTNSKPMVLYTLTTGKIDKVFACYKIWKIDNGGPTETAFKNQFPDAIKVTDLA